MLKALLLELERCDRKIVAQDRYECFCRVERLLAKYFKPYHATTNHQETEPDQV
jgi:hypothetical protein